MPLYGAGPYVMGFTCHGTFENMVNPAMLRHETASKIRAFQSPVRPGGK